MPVRRKKSIQLFNFSFVDILATTIGVLLFIMLMAVLNVSGVAAHSEAKRKVREAEKKADEIRNGIKDAQERLKDTREENDKLRKVGQGDTSELTAQIKKLEDANRKIEQENLQLVADIKSREKLRNKYRKELESLQKQMADSDKSFRLPKAAGGSKSTPIHVECTSTGLTILGTDVTKNKDGREFCPKNQISSSAGVFGKLVKQAAATRSRSGSARKVIVLWVKPDALETATQAIQAAKNGGASLGWEPCAADWGF